MDLALPTRRFLHSFGVLRLSMIAKSLFQPSILGASAIVEHSAGEIVLVKHSYMPGWGLPGGGVQRGEPAEHAVIRELQEEIGLIQSAPPEFLSLHTRKVAWFTNVIALYRLRDASIRFKPNFEIREARFFDPSALPDDTTPGTLRRLAELAGKAPRSLYW
jgi:ADP-ribose pyrophosphatase YjhB (NUDIX family)